MRVFDLGRRDYLATWRLQEALATRLRRGEGESLVLVEHPHVFTIGRSGSLEHLTASATELRELGAQVFRVDRGGDITYHGPGQLVAYPIVDLGRLGGDVVAYVRALEGAVIAVASTYGVAARRAAERTGVWVTPAGAPPAKLCAIGVRVSRGVTTHGLALNVATDLAWFERMVPCGFAHQATSLAALGVSASLDEVKSHLARSLAETLRADPSFEGAPPEPRDDELRETAPVRSAVDLLRDPIAA